MTPRAFEDWVAAEVGIDDEDIAAIKLSAVFDLFISRIEAAQARGAKDPLQTVTAKLAGGNSRACTKQMLNQLGFTPPQRRAAHRLLAGSPSGWPGLLRLYVAQGQLTQQQRQYARRQVSVLRTQPLVPRSEASAPCVTNASTP